MATMKTKYEDEIAELHAAVNRLLKVRFQHALNVSLSKLTCIVSSWDFKMFKPHIFFKINKF